MANTQAKRDWNREYQRKYRAKNPEKCIAATQKWRDENPEKTKNMTPQEFARKRLCETRYRARRLGLKFNLTEDDILSAWPLDGKCPILGVKFVFGKRSEDNASIDKLRPGDGYTKGNIRIICKRANTIKHNATDPEELRKVAEWLERELKAAGDA